MDSASTNYSINSTHRFFAEAFHFTVVLTGFNALMAHQAAQETIHQLVNTVNLAQRKPICGTVSDGPLSEPYWLMDKDCEEQTDLYGIPAMGKYLGSHDVIKPDSIDFIIRPFSGQIPTKGHDQTERRGRGTPLEELMTSLCCYLIGGAFERCKTDIKSAHGTNPSQWPTALQFFRHLRNGCFHKNTFNILPFRGSPSIDPSNPPSWHTYSMASDSNMNGQKAVNGYFRIPHFLPFIHDIAHEL